MKPRKQRARTTRVSSLADLPPPPEGRTGWPWTLPSNARAPGDLAERSWPKISIVTPSFNQGDFLEETLRSVLGQGYPNLEYFVIDGGSTDTSVQILEKYDRYLTAWVSEPDDGQSAAINKGLRLCSGDLFNWLNSDDTYEPQALFRVARHCLAHPDKNLFCAVERGVDHAGGESLGISEGTYVGDSLEKTLFVARIDQPVTFFGREPLDRIGELDAGLHYKMDSDLWLRYLLLFGLDGVWQTRDVLVNFRYHDQSKSVAFAERFERERNRLLCRLARTVGLGFVPDDMALLYGDDPDDDERAYECRVAVDRSRLERLFRKRFAWAFFNRDLLDQSRKQIRASARSLMDVSDLPGLRLAWAMWLLPNPVIELIRKLNPGRFFSGNR